MKAEIAFEVQGSNLADMEKQTDAWLAQLGGFWDYELHNIQPIAMSYSGEVGVWQASVRGQSVPPGQRVV